MVKGLYETGSLTGGSKKSMLKKRTGAILLACSMLVTMLTGCTQKTKDNDIQRATESNETVIPNESSSVAEASAQEPETESTAAQTQPETNAATTGTQAEYTYTGNWQDLPNDSIPYGNSATDRDELNVPNGVYYYKKLYSGYGADFIQDTSQKIIYLTMDEGYEAGYTPMILDTLKEKGVKAVFFLTKQFVDSDPELVQRMIDEGHILGNHTCAHPSEGMPSLGADAEIADINKLHDMVQDQFGYDLKLFRFPEGTFSEQSLALVHSLGYESVFWSFAYTDYNVNAQKDPAEALQNCMTQLHPGAIYLLHAVSSTNCAILGDFIDGVRAQGYEFGVYPVQ